MIEDLIQRYELLKRLTGIQKSLDGLSSCKLKDALMKDIESILNEERPYTGQTEYKRGDVKPTSKNAVRLSRSHYVPRTRGNK